jgi:hypothetical protein
MAGNPPGAKRSTEPDPRIAGREEDCSRKVGDIIPEARPPRREILLAARAPAA